MGYTTDFTGEFEITPVLTPEQVAYIRAFADTRRMGRYEEKAAKESDPVREAVGLPIGCEGGYYVGDADPGFATRCGDGLVIDINTPPKGQPGLWCQWVSTADGSKLGWDGGEKFYHYTEWLRYLIEHFFEKWDRKLNGEVCWSGEDSTDLGKIVVVDNEVTVLSGTVTYHER